MPKSPANQHKWHPLSSDKGLGCEKCNYKVVSVPPNDPNTRGGSRHVPGERCIYTVEVEITEQIANKLCKIWGIVCVSSNP